MTLYPVTILWKKIISDWLMLIGNEAKVTPTPLVEAKAIKKLSPNVKITFNLSSVTPD